MLYGIVNHTLADQVKDVLHGIVKKIKDVLGPKCVVWDS